MTHQLPPLEINWTPEVKRAIRLIAEIGREARRKRLAAERAEVLELETTTATVDVQAANQSVLVRDVASSSEPSAPAPVPVGAGADTETQP